MLDVYCLLARDMVVQRVCVIAVCALGHLGLRFLINLARALYS